MLRASAGDTAGGISAMRLDGRPVESPIGLRILVPGLLAASLGPEAARLGVPGLVRLGPARRRSGPGERRSAGVFWPWHSSRTSHQSPTCFVKARFRSTRRSGRSCSSTLSLALVLYLPVVTVLSVLAWPGIRAGQHGRRFSGQSLRLPRAASPARANGSGCTLPPPGEPRAAQVVAISGQEVEWTGQKLEGRWQESVAPFTRPIDRPGRRPAGSRSRPTRSWSSLAMTASRPFPSARSCLFRPTASSAAPGPSSTRSGIAACSRIGRYDRSSALSSPGGIAPTCIARLIASDYPASRASAGVDASIRRAQSLSRFPAHGAVGTRKKIAESRQQDVRVDMITVRWLLHRSSRASSAILSAVHR